MRLSAALSFALICILSSCRGASADGPLPSVERLQLGFGNTYKLGCWTPVEIKLTGALGDSGAAGQIEIEAPDNDGVPVRFVGPKIIWTMGQTCHGYLKVGRPDARLDVLLRKTTDLESAEPIRLAVSSIAPVPRALAGTNQLVLEIGAPIGLADLYKRKEQSDLGRATVISVESGESLPDQCYGYEGVDLISIAARPATENNLLSSVQIDAIEQWVKMGGKLVISCGGRFAEIFRASAPLARFAPGNFVQTVQRKPPYQAIESFAQSEGQAESKLDADAAAPETMQIAQWRNVRGRVDLYDQVRTAPLVARWPYGFGQVIFVGLDLHAEPFNHWFERPLFLEHVLSTARRALLKSDSQNIALQSRQLGFIDLAGQLRTALDQFDGIRIAPFWAIGVLSLAYIGLLFPLNYYIATRWLKRRWIAWLFLPTVIIFVSAAALAWASASRGRSLRANQLDLCDVDVESQWVRGTSWFNVYSPANETVNVRLTPLDARQERETSRAASSLLGWFGLTGSGLGGMSSRASIAPLFDLPYSINLNEGTAKAVPLTAGSSKSFVDRWSTAALRINQSLTARGDGRLSGSLTSRLPFGLTNCHLVFGRWVYSVQRIEPEQMVRLDKMEAQPLTTYLLKQSSFAIKEDTLPYDRTGFDLARILEVMMFYDLAGGGNYTGLLNRQHNELDISDQIELGRAVLVGEGPAAAELEIDNRALRSDEVSRHAALYRFALSVGPSSSGAAP